MTKKICTGCGLNKPLNKFHKRKRNKSGVDSICKSCSNEKMRLYRKTDYYKKYDSYRKKKRYYEYKEKIQTYLLQHPCIDCGNADIRVLEFDHVRGIKEYEISFLLNRWTWMRIEQEIAKCEVRCANCHKIRHTERPFISL